VRQATEHREPAADRVRPRRQALVRQRLPRREDRDAVGWHEAAERVGEVVGLPPGRGDGQHRPVRGDRGDDEGTGGGRRRDVGLLPLVGFRQFSGAGECAVGQGGGQEAGEFHSQVPLRTAC
jgi:hypothetical protein